MDERRPILRFGIALQAIRGWEVQLATGFDSPMAEWCGSEKERYVKYVFAFKQEYQEHCIIEGEQ